MHTTEKDRQSDKERHHKAETVPSDATGCVEDHVVPDH
jgi:hypothetical protein